MGNKQSAPGAANAPGATNAPAVAPVAPKNSAPLFSANSTAGSAPLPPVVQAANKKLVTAQNNAARASAALAAQQATVSELNAKYNLLEPMQGGRKSRKNKSKGKSRKGKSRKGKGKSRK